MYNLKTVVGLALRDYLHERLLSLCAVLGLAAVLAPLLVLFGVKSGIINTMTNRLVKDPRNLEITPVGTGSYRSEWLSRMAKHSGVAFIIPQTRSIAASMVLYKRDGGQVKTLGVDLIPTAKGDPLVEKWASVPDNNMSIILSEPASQKLHVTKGQEVVGLVGRILNGSKEQVRIKLNVVAVLPIEATQRRIAFVRFALLEAIEDYRDGLESKAFGWPGQTRPPGPREYPSFRLYARSIYDVAALREILQNQGVDVYTKAAEIKVVQNLNRSFTLIFALIAIAAVFGYFASMASNVLAGVKRKSRHLAIIRLIGFSTGSIVWFPVVQALVTSVLGSMVAVFLYSFTEILINRLFSQYLSRGEYVCRILPEHLFVAFGLTLLLSAFASAYAAFRAAKIEPSEVIRDV